MDCCLSVGRPDTRHGLTVRYMWPGGAGFVMSEYPLAGVHIAQGIEKQNAGGPKPELVSHPVQLLACARTGSGV